MKIKRFFSIVTILIALAAVFSLLAMNVTNAAAYKALVAETKPVVDGKSDEYAGEPLQIGKASVRISVWQDAIFVHATAKGAGWIAIAFNKQGKGMDGSNMVIGYLDSTGKPQVRNDLGRGWSHAASKMQGVVEYAIVQSEGGTSLEFSYPLAFAEGYALKALERGGTFSLVMAGNERSFSLTSKHTWAAKADFSL